MNITVYRGETRLRVQNTPEALFKAAGVLALAGVLLAVLNNR